jgi:hypothetical protein
MPSSQPSSLAEIESQAYLIYSEWGPRRQIPRDQRLSECFPDIPEGTMKEFDRVEHAIWKAAEAGGPRTGTFEAFTRRMRKLFPIAVLIGSVLLADCRWWAGVWAEQWFYFCLNLGMCVYN